MSELVSQVGLFSPVLLSGKDMCVSASLGR